jgi:hypothetical protein
MSDLLSAATLLLTALTIIYGLWYPKMLESLDVAVPPHKEDRRKPRLDVSRTLSSRAVPLVVISGALTTVFVPDSVRLVRASFVNFSENGFSSLHDYDSIEASFLAVVFLLAFLTAHLFAVAIRLCRLRKRLSLTD